MNSIELFKLTEDNEDSSSNIDLSEDQDVMGTSGLINQGNTCYMNSIIQCLSNCEDFRNLIIGKDLVAKLIDGNSNMFIEKSKLETNLSFQLRKIFINIWNSSFYSFRPISFRKLFGKKIDQFQNSNQQDSQEALLCILDSINDELAMEVKINPANKNMIYDCLENLHKDEESNQQAILKIIKSNISDYLNYKSINDYKISHRKYSPINAIFEGRTISQLVCLETQGIKTNFESFFYFTLALPQDKYEDFTESDSSTSSKHENKSSSNYWCKTCKKNLQSSKCYDEHIQGRKHKNKENFYNEISSSPGSEDIYQYNYDSNEEQNDSDKKKEEQNESDEKEEEQNESDEKEEEQNQSAEKEQNESAEEEQNQSDEEEQQNESDEEEQNDSDDYSSIEISDQEKSDFNEDSDKESDQDSDQDSDKESEQDSDEESDDDSDISKMYNSFSTLDLFKKNNYTSRKKVLKKFSLYDLLDNHVIPEKLEDDNKWFSPYANKLVDAEKCNLIWESPKILIILLKRFEYTYTGATKLNNIINFPFEDLDITPYLHPNHVSKYTKYDLFAINNHTNFSSFGFNGISFGHYYSYCKNYTNNKWYNYDDANVSEMNEKDLITKHAYMLFYRARE